MLTIDVEHFTHTYIRTSKHTHIFLVEYFSVILELTRYKDKFTGDIYGRARKFFISISVTIFDCVIQVIDSNGIHTILNVLSWKLS